MGRMKRALRTCAFALGVMAAFATSVRADAGTSVQLGGSTAGWQQNSPALSGSGVVWTNFDGTQFDIYYQDVSIAGSTASNLTANLPGDQFLQDIDRGSVVFTNTKPGAASSDILLIDAATKLTTNIASGGSSVNFAHPAISSDWIVFERITTQYDIDLVDRSTNSSPGFQVTFDAAAQRFPRVSGNVVVYEDYNANPNIASVDACIIGSAGCATFSVAAVGRQPDVDGDNIVYVGKDGGRQRPDLPRQRLGRLRDSGDHQHRLGQVAAARLGQPRRVERSARRRLRHLQLRSHGEGRSQGARPGRRRRDARRHRRRSPRLPDLGAARSSSSPSAASRRATCRPAATRPRPMRSTAP